VVDWLTPNAPRWLNPNCTHGQQQESAHALTLRWSANVLDDQPPWSSSVAAHGLGRCNGSAMDRPAAMFRASAVVHYDESGGLNSRLHTYDHMLHCLMVGAA